MLIVLIVILLFSGGESSFCIGENCFCEQFLISKSDFGVFGGNRLQLVSKFMRSNRKLLSNMKSLRLQVADYCFVKDEDFNNRFT